MIQALAPTLQQQALQPRFLSDLRPLQEVLGEDHSDTACFNEQLNPAMLNM